MLARGTTGFHCDSVSFLTYFGYERRNLVGCIAILPRCWTLSFKFVGPGSDQCLCGRGGAGGGVSGGG